MKPLLIVTSDMCLQHDTGPGHPESKARLQAILQRLRHEDMSNLVWQEATPALLDDVCRVHDRAYVNRIQSVMPVSGYAAIDADTVISPDSWAAALYAAGAVIDAVGAVMSGHYLRAFCPVRPPGHHAERSKAMGFCLLNNIMIAAASAIANEQCKKICILDFDVHHGNGTQHQVQAFNQGQKQPALMPALMYVSWHQYPLYPGTGGPNENNSAAIVNLPLPAGSSGIQFMDAMRQFVVPAVHDFRPDLILISAGFDAHEQDPLATMKMTDDDYFMLTREIVILANQVCDGRIVSALEGGYNISALADAVGQHVKAMKAE